MEDYSVETFVNRGDAIPVLNVSGNDEGPLGLSSDEDRDKRRQLKVQAAGNDTPDSASPVSSPQAHKQGRSLQDRLFSKFVRCHHEVQKPKNPKASFRKMGS